MSMHRILMIEDDPGIALTVGDLLRAEAYEFQLATDGESGLDQLAGGRP